MQGLASWLFEVVVGLPNSGNSTYSENVAVCWYLTQRSWVTFWTEAWTHCSLVEKRAGGPTVCHVINSEPTARYIYIHRDFNATRPTQNRYPHHTHDRNPKSAQHQPARHLHDRQLTHFHCQDVDGLQTSLRFRQTNTASHRFRVARHVCRPAFSCHIGSSVDSTTLSIAQCAQRLNWCITIWRYF